MVPSEKEVGLHSTAAMICKAFKIQIEGGIDIDDIPIDDLFKPAAEIESPSKTVEKPSTGTYTTEKKSRIRKPRNPAPGHQLIRSQNGFRYLMFFFFLMSTDFFLMIPSVYFYLKHFEDPSLLLLTIGGYMFMQAVFSPVFNYLVYFVMTDPPCFQSFCLSGFFCLLSFFFCIFRSSNLNVGPSWKVSSQQCAVVADKRPFTYGDW